MGDTQPLWMGGIVPSASLVSPYVGAAPIPSSVAQATCVLMSTSSAVTLPRL